MSSAPEAGINPAQVRVLKPQSSGVPFLDLKAQFATIRDEVMAAVEAVFENQAFILGPEVQQFEAEIARLVESEFAIGCASGSDALLLALMAIGVEPGDEVVTTPFTFGATVGAIARLRAVPKFVDIHPETYNIDTAQLEHAIGPRTRAILPIHLFGLSADMEPMLRTADARGIAVIEDAAQAIGARYHGRAVGTLGTAACFSFFPSKNLGGAGDGGMITTNDPELASRLKVLRVHGCREKYRYEVVGANSRLDALQAAVLRVKLRHLDGWTQARRRNAERYRALFRNANLLEHVALPVEPENYFHVFNQFVLRVRDRDGLRAHLRAVGIPTEVYYPAPLHLEAAYRSLGHMPGDFPESERASKETLALPIYAELTEAQQAQVVDAIAAFYALATQRVAA